MARKIDPRTYILLERAFVRRLQRSWQKESGHTYEAIAAACNAHEWDRARRLVSDLDMSEVGVLNREWIQYMLLSFAVFGATIISRSRPSFVGIGTFDTLLRQVTNTFLMYLEHGATRQVQQEALQLIARDEQQQKELTQKFNPYHVSSGEKGGQFTTKEGMRAATEADVERLKALKVPPAWKQIQVSIQPHAALQAVGLDAKGRMQYIYSAAHSAKAAAEKFARVKEFAKKLPGLRQTILKDLDSDVAADKEAASVLYLIDKTGFRVGSDEDTKADVKAHGATTLLDKHAVVHGTETTFSFIGKKGVEIEKVVKDGRLAKMIQSRKRKVKADEPLFETTDAAVRKYMTRHAPGFSPKDFRTHQGTGLALSEIKKRPQTQTEKEFTKAQKEIATIVAAHLGNTPAVSLKQYIDPAVWGRMRRK